MKTNTRSLTSLLAGLALAVCLAPVASAQIVLTENSGATNRYNGTVGFSFTVNPDINLNVSHVGVLNINSTFGTKTGGLANDVQWGVWEVTALGAGNSITGSTLVASGTITAGTGSAAANGGVAQRWAYADVGDFVMTGGKTYVLAALLPTTGGDFYRDVGSGTPAAFDTSVASSFMRRFSSTTGSLVVANSTFGTTADGYTGPNLLFTTSPIPEPSAFAAVAGFGALGFAALRRRRRA